MKPKSWTYSEIISVKEDERHLFMRFTFYRIRFRNFKRSRGFVEDDKGIYKKGSLLL